MNQGPTHNQIGSGFGQGPPESRTGPYPDQAVEVVMITASVSVHHRLGRHCGDGAIGSGGHGYRCSRRTDQVGLTIYAGGEVSPVALDDERSGETIGPNHVDDGGAPDRSSSPSR